MEVPIGSMQGMGSMAGMGPMGQSMNMGGPMGRMNMGGPMGGSMKMPSTMGGSMGGPMGTMGGPMGTMPMSQMPTSQSGDQWQAQREDLIRQIQRQEQMIKDLRMTAENMPQRPIPVNYHLSDRLDDVEAKILAAKLVPVSSAEDMIPSANEPSPNRIPNGLLQEFWHRDIIEIAGGGDDDDDDGDDHEDELEKARQHELFRVSMMLGLPMPMELGLPSGSRIVDIRQIEGPDVPEWQMAPLPRGPITPNPQNRPRPPPPVLRGSIHDSNYALVPSPYHPVGPASRMIVNGRPLLSNLYPIDRAPIRYEDVFANPKRGAPIFTPAEKTYKAYADHFEARRFPACHPEATWDRDIDRGMDVRNVQWRCGFSGRGLAAKAVDLNRDGYADVVVVGADRRGDGIPDVLQVSPTEKCVTNTLSSFFYY